MNGLKSISTGPAGNTAQLTAMKQFLIFTRVLRLFELSHIQLIQVKGLCYMFTLTSNLLLWTTVQETLIRTRNTKSFSDLCLLTSQLHPSAGSVVSRWTVIIEVLTSIDHQKIWHSRKHCQGYRAQKCCFCVGTLRDASAH